MIDPDLLLQNLIRFDTTNPPGNEIGCIQYIQSLLAEADIPATLLTRTENRPNLIARLAGRGQAPPLLLTGHVDVVTTANQQWEQPPFSANLVDGYIWGRGALDMKGGVAMMLTAFLRAKARGLAPAGDLLLAIVADEEAGGNDGAKFLVNEHADLFQGVRYAIGEFGGFAMTVAGQRFYPIMVAEKQICWIKGVVRGPAGHASRPIRGGAMAKLAHVLQKLDRNRLPVHITPAVEEMVKAMAAALPPTIANLLMGLLKPEQTDKLLDNLGETAGMFDAVMHNTVSPTIVYGGDKINVIPSQITLEMDGRVLPGQQAEDLLAELGQLVGDEIELEIVRFDPGPPSANMDWFEALAQVIREADPAGMPIPYVLSGVTDARHFARLGIQTYGFLPMNLPPHFNFGSTIHAPNERIPAGTVAFGADCVYRAIEQYRVN